MPATKPADKRKPVKGKPVVVTGARGGRKLLNKRQPQADGTVEGDVDLRGRPTKYHPGLDFEAYKFALLGYSNTEIARVLDIDSTTLERWVDSFPSFRAKIREGQETADASVAEALFRTARGYDAEIEELKVVTKNRMSGEQHVIKEKVRKYFPGDYRAQALWLQAVSKRAQGDADRASGKTGYRRSWDAASKDPVGHSPVDAARAAREAIAAADAETE